MASAILAFLACPVVVSADLTGTSHISRGGDFAAAAGPAMSGSSRSTTATGGQSEALGVAGTSTDLTTNAPGFWYGVLGDVPGLDPDVDGISYLVDNCASVANPGQEDFDGDGAGDACDTDDDDDGLLDVVETNTGVFVSPADTGSNPLNADSDGDGFDDGTEVAAGSDPNNPLSTPDDPNPSVPGLTGLAPWLLGVAMLLVALRAVRIPIRERTKS